MTVLKYGAIVLFSFTALILLIFSIKSRRPLRFLLFNAFMGVSVLLILYFTRKFTGLNIALNPYTVGSSALFGIPSVIGILILNFIMLM